MHKTTLLAALTALIAGCVTVQMPEVALTHPAHPDAEQPEPPLTPNVLAVPAQPIAAPPLPIDGIAPSPSPHAGHGVHDTHAGPENGSPAPGPYVCPMHPEVTSDRPGTCPKCGMDLELQEVQP